jgi:hypothetical protein
MVMFAGSTFELDEVELADLFEPPHAVTVSRSSTPIAAKTRDIPSSDLVKVLNAIYDSFG